MSEHPVQFSQTDIEYVLSCTVCRALVLDIDQYAHRGWHDTHNDVHDVILHKANSYTPPPRYG